jgi:zinc transporter ZupT
VTLRAALLALCSALGGGAIALAARKHPSVLERTRTFAFAAAAGVVAFHLLPEVLPEQGLMALAWCGVGFALPWLLEAAAKAVGPRLLKGRGFSGFRVAAELGFAALLFHSIVEGLALVAALAQPGEKLDLEVALVAHHAPLTAAVVLPFLELKGARAVAIRAAIVGACGALGALASGVFPGFSEGAMLQRATAVTAGALLHVVADEIREQRFSSRWERAGDLAACAVGLGMAGLGAVLNLRHEAQGAPMVELLQVLTALALAAAPALLAGALLAPFFRAPRFDALFLALALLGGRFFLALGALAGASRSSWAERMSPLDAVRVRAPRLLLLLIAAAAIELSLDRLSDSPAVAIGLLVALLIAARLDEAGAVAVASPLLHKGLPPAAVLAALALGALARGPFEWQRTALSAAVIAAAGFSHWLQRTPSSWDLRAPLANQIAASPLGAVAAAALILLALHSLWMQGVRGWFIPLRHKPD